MMSRHIPRPCGFLILVLAALSEPIVAQPVDTQRIVQVNPGPKSQFDLQAALINAVPGDVIEIAEGHYALKSEINVVCDNVTIRGAGPDRTILSFREQAAGSNGLSSTGNAIVIENLAVEDTVGNAIKTLGARDVTFRNVRVEWTDGPKTTNGAYGIYPVECENVLIENCTAIAASDAGIYVGQSKDVIVRGCTTRRNVAGIEIENTVRADVFDNVSEDNTGGILVFDLPGLNVTNGGHVRVFQNRIMNNNHANFAARGTMVSDVPAGSGIMLMATDHVEIFDNEIADHQTANVIVVSFLITERKVTDENYDAWPEATSIHHNRISNGGYAPAGKFGAMLSPFMGGTFPDIFYDGLVDSRKLKEGRLPAELALSIHDNGDATFANVNIADLTPSNLLSGEYGIDRELKTKSLPLARLSQVSLKPHSPPKENSNPAVAVYRSAPKRLSEWGLFVLDNAEWKPAPDVLHYDLNTSLFSDYATKHRFIRLPEGAAMSWHATRTLEFPVGTVIAKTFAYPDMAEDQTPKERFVETRIEHRDATGWYGYSYIWQEDQQDARLQLGGGVIDIKWIDADGITRENAYQVPNANQCLSCHAQNDGYQPLGPTARNLNRSGLDDSRNQLAQWIDSGILVNAPDAEKRPILATWNKGDADSVDARARAWLEVNCAHCHNPEGSARTSGLDLRTSQSSPGRFGVMKTPVAAGKGSGGRRYDVVPGKPEESILMFRLETDEPGARMPNLARNLNHEESNRLIHDWISSMSPESPDNAE